MIFSLYPHYYPIASTSYPIKSQFLLMHQYHVIFPLWLAYVGFRFPVCHLPFLAACPLSKCLSQATQWQCR